MPVASVLFRRLRPDLVLLQPVPPLLGLAPRGAVHYWPRGAWPPPASQPVFWDAGFVVPRRALARFSAALLDMWGPLGGVARGTCCPEGHLATYAAGGPGAFGVRVPQNRSTFAFAPLPAAAILQRHGCQLECFDVAGSEGKNNGSAAAHALRRGCEEAALAARMYPATLAMYGHPELAQLAPSLPCLSTAGLGWVGRRQCCREQLGVACKQMSPAGRHGLGWGQCVT